MHGGDRLPWLPSEFADNFAPLRSLDWQLHVYGACDDRLRQACDRLRLPLHVFGWSDAAEAAGLGRNAAYLIRPDGYVALAADEAAGPESLRSFVANLGLRFSPCCGTRGDSRSG